jgi:hypothetical protein
MTSIMIRQSGFYLTMPGRIHPIAHEFLAKKGIAKRLRERKSRSDVQPHDRAGTDGKTSGGPTAAPGNGKGKAKSEPIVMTNSLFLELYDRLPKFRRRVERVTQRDKERKDVLLGPQQLRGKGFGSGGRLFATKRAMEKAVDGDGDAYDNDPSRVGFTEKKARYEADLMRAEHMPVISILENRQRQEMAAESTVRRVKMALGYPDPRHSTLKTQTSRWAKTSASSETLDFGPEYDEYTLEGLTERRYWELSAFEVYQWQVERVPVKSTCEHGMKATGYVSQSSKQAIGRWYKRAELRELRNTCIPRSPACEACKGEKARDGKWKSYGNDEGKW